jgi:hypothetical protein
VCQGWRISSVASLYNLPSFPFAYSAKEAAISPAEAFDYFRFRLAQAQMIHEWHGAASLARLANHTGNSPSFATSSFKKARTLALMAFKSRSCEKSIVSFFRLCLLSFHDSVRNRITPSSERRGYCASSKRRV